MYIYKKSTSEREMDFIDSSGDLDHHQPGQGANYALIVLHLHFAFPFRQM